MQLTVKSCNILATNDFFYYVFWMASKVAAVQLGIRNSRKILRVSFKRFYFFFVTLTNHTDFKIISSPTYLWHSN